MKELVTTTSPEETISLGRQLAKKLLPGSVVCLQGDLGAGKTQLVKGIAAGFGVPENAVNSPTFTLIHEYRQGTVPVYHFDCYRLKNENEAKNIGTEEYFYGDGICVVEWPEKIKTIIPDNAVFIEIRKLNNSIRNFSILFP